MSENCECGGKVSISTAQQQSPRFFQALCAWSHDLKYIFIILAIFLLERRTGTCEEPAKKKPNLSLAKMYPRLQCLWVCVAVLLGTVVCNFYSALDVFKEILDSCFVTRILAQLCNIYKYMIKLFFIKNKNWMKRLCVISSTVHHKLLYLMENQEKNIQLSMPGIFTQCIIVFGNNCFVSWPIWTWKSTQVATGFPHICEHKQTIKNNANGLIFSTEASKLHNTQYK